MPAMGKVGKCYHIKYPQIICKIHSDLRDYNAEMMSLRAEKIYGGCWVNERQAEMLGTLKGSLIWICLVTWALATWLWGRAWGRGNAQGPDCIRLAWTRPRPLAETIRKDVFALCPAPPSELGWPWLILITAHCFYTPSFLNYGKIPIT